MKTPLKPGTPVRGSKTGRPIMVLLDLLGRRWALRVLWELSRRPLTFRELQSACGDISPTVLNSRLTELREADVVSATEAGYGLTPEGVLARFDATVQTVEPAPRASAVCKDADDQPFIDLAAAHGAILLSKDKAVLRLRKRLSACGAETATSLSFLGHSEPACICAATL